MCVCLSPWQRAKKTHGVRADGDVLRQERIDTQLGFNYTFGMSEVQTEEPEASTAGPSQIAGPRTGRGASAEDR